MRKNYIYKEKKGSGLNKKLALVYILAGFLPVLAIIIINFLLTKDSYKKEEITNFENYVELAINNLDTRLGLYNNVSEYVSNSVTIKNVVFSDYEDETSMNYKFNALVVPIMESMLYMHDEIVKLTIYVDGKVGQSNDYLGTIEEVKYEKWFSGVTKDNEPHWYVDAQSDRVILSRKFEENGKYAVMCMELSYKYVVEPFNKKLIEDYGLFITDRVNNEFFSYYSFGNDNKDYEMPFEEILHLYIYKDNRYRIFVKDSQYTDWKVWLYKPEELFATSINQITKLTIWGIVLCMLTTFLCVRFTGFVVVKRINKLKDAVALIEKEDFSVELSSTSKDEIGELTNSFSRMEKKLNHLINEVYKSKIHEKEYEMKALQAQINPHFLYNTLSLINWKAIEAKQMDISKVTLALSTFYRTSLNKGNNITTLAGEIENMRSYLSIQLMLHDGDFDVEEDIDESILKYHTLNLVLQPLIENAIDHGIDVMPEDQRGKITIKGKDLGNIIELSVIDNGIGMTQEQAEKILTSESKGYGVRNVNERIKLYYGNQYPLIIRSRESKGTEVIITIPKENQTS